MTIDASAVAAALGISSEFVDLRDGQAALLPQQIFVLGQGNTDKVYSFDKTRALSPGQIAAKYGFGSQLHLTIRELLPENGDGVGTIPVYVLPLGDHVSGVAATGGLVISGTAEAAKEYQVSIGGVNSDKFVVPKGTVDATVAHVAAYDAITAIPHMPAKCSFVYGSATSEADDDNVGDGALGTVTINGTPRPGVWTLTCTAESADAGTFSLTDPDGNVVTPAVTVASAYDANGLSFTLADGSEDWDEGDKIYITVPVTGLAFAARSKGAWTNDIDLRAITPDQDFGVDFTFTAMSGGLVNPVVSPGLDKIQGDWQTIGLNCLNIEDTDNLDLIQTRGEGSWAALVNRPGVWFTGNTKTTFEELTAVSSVRKTDRVNGQLIGPGSPNLPCVVAARQIARIGKVANNDPAVDYIGQEVTGITVGSVEFDYLVRDALVKAGSSTVEVRNGVYYIGDTCTFYNPEEEQPPGYRFVVDIVRTQNVNYNVWLEFVKNEWAAAPLLPDSEPTASTTARKPKTFKAKLEQIFDGLADRAIIANREKAKKSINPQIVGPRRLNISYVTPYSGNTAIKDFQHQWGFIFNNG